MFFSTQTSSSASSSMTRTFFDFSDLCLLFDSLSLSCLSCFLLLELLSSSLWRFLCFEDLCCSTSVIASWRVSELPPLAVTLVDRPMLTTTTALSAFYHNLNDQDAWSSQFEIYEKAGVASFWAQVPFRSFISQLRPLEAVLPLR